MAAKKTKSNSTSKRGANVSTAAKSTPAQKTPAEKAPARSARAVDTAEKAEKRSGTNAAKRATAKRAKTQAPESKRATPKGATKERPATTVSAAKPNGARDSAGPTTAKTPAAQRPAKKASSKIPVVKNAAPSQSTTDEPAEPEERVSSTKSQAAAEVAERVLAGEDEKTIADLGDDLVSGKKSVAAQAGRVLDEIIERRPEAVVPIIDRFAKVIGGPDKRPAQSAARALPLMARVAPARVARHLPRLKEGFDSATEPGKDGLVRTFAGLCTASVAYQKKLEDVLNKALREADAKTLITWTEVVLPALKGEPHARARATVEGRLGRIPKVHAQKIADFLGIRLRLRYR